MHNSVYIVDVYVKKVGLRGTGPYTVMKTSEPDSMIQFIFLSMAAIRFHKCYLAITSITKGFPENPRRTGK